MPTRGPDDLRLTPEDRKTIFKPFALLALVPMVAIVVVLLSHSLRPQVNRGNCYNNLKECGIALLLYCEDYDGCLPSSAIVNHSKTWKRKDFVHFSTRLGQVPVPTNAGFGPGTWVQALYRHMKGRGIMFCPDDETDRLNADASGPHYKPDTAVSYYWKTAVDRAWYGVGCNRPYKRLIDYKQANQIVLYERRAFHQERGKLWLKHNPGLENGVKINVAYLDTHVQCITLTNATTDDPNHPELATNGEPMYFNYDQDKPKGPANPPSPKVPAKYVDPSRYSDQLP